MAARGARDASTSIARRRAQAATPRAASQAAAAQRRSVATASGRIAAQAASRGAPVDVLFGQAYFLRFDPKLWEARQPYAPLGALYAAACVRERGYRVALFDAMLADVGGRVGRRRSTAIARASR